MINDNSYHNFLPTVAPNFLPTVAPNFLQNYSTPNFLHNSNSFY